jgi:predicted Zn-dependent protease
MLARLSQFTGNPTLVEILLMNHPLPGERVQALREELKQNPPPKGLENDSLAFRAAKLGMQLLPPAPPPAPKKPAP